MTVLGSSIAAIAPPPPQKKKEQKQKGYFFTLLILSGAKPHIKYGPNKLGKEVEQNNRANKSGQTGSFEVGPQTIKFKITSLHKSAGKQSHKEGCPQGGLSLFQCDCFGFSLVSNGFLGC